MIPFCLFKKILELIRSTLYLKLLFTRNMSNDVYVGYGPMAKAATGYQIYSVMRVAHKEI